MVILTSKSSPGSRLQSAVKSHLPNEASAVGVSATEIAAASRAYLADVKAGKKPAVDPYGTKIGRGDAVEISQNVDLLATGAANDFRTNTSHELRGPQLRTAVQQAGESAKQSIAELSEERGDLKSAYNWQVAKTVGWMAGTAGALITGGLLPNPVSVLAVGAFSVMTIRSINKARAAQKSLSKALPMLDAGLKANRQILADTVAYGPHLLAWENALTAKTVTAQAA